MSQISSTLHTPAVPAFGGANRRLLPIAMIAFVLFAAALIAYQVRTVPATNNRGGQAVDGWEAGIATMTAQSAVQVAQSAQDGYLSGLLAARASGDAVDGYLPGLLAEHQIGAVDDGWERGINLFPTPRSTVQDGWEAGLN